MKQHNNFFKDFINKNIEYLIIICIIAMGIVIKIELLFLNRDYWHDEAFQFLYSLKPISFILNSTDVHPPLFNLISKVITWLTPSVLGTRFFMLFMSILMVFFVYIFMEKHFNKLSGYIAISIFSIFPTWAFYSIEFRSYMFAFMIIPLQMLFFYNFMLYKDNFNRNIWLWIILSLILIYTHYFTALFIFAQICFLLFKHKHDLKKFILPLIFSIISSIPLIIYFLNTLPKIESFWFKQITIKSLLSTFAYIITPNLEGYFSIIVLIFFILFLYLIFYSIKQKSFNLKYKLLLAQGIVPILILFIISQVHPIYHHRYFLFGGMSLMMLFSVLIIDLIYKTKNEIKLKNNVVFMIIVLLISIFGYNTLSLNFNYEVKESSQFIKNIIETDPFNNKYAIIHTSTFSQSPYKVYFYDSNVKNYLISNLSVKKLFTAGGSVINPYERITLEDINTLKADKIYFVSDKPIGDVVVWGKGGLYISRNKNYAELILYD